MDIRSVVGLMVLGGTVAIGGAASADTRRPDRPDGGPPLIQLPSKEAAPPQAGAPAGTPAPRSLDSKRTPMPDREALPQDLQDAPLAPPTAPIPQTGDTTTTKSGGGAARVRDIFYGQPYRQPGSGGNLPARDSVTRTPEDVLAPPPPSR
jgi:hypothetical protein